MCRTATCKILFKCLAVPGVFLEILRNLSWTENIPISLNSTSMATIIPGLASACDAFAKSYLAQVFGLKIHQSMRHHATPPNSRWVSGHGKFPHRWDWSSPIAWGCPVQFGPKLTNAGNPHPSLPIYPSKCSHICCVKLSKYTFSNLHLMLSTMPSAWHCGPQCSGVHDLHKLCGVNGLSSWPFVLPWANAHPGDCYHIVHTTTWWDPLVSHLQANWDFHSHAVFVRTSW